MSESLKPRFEVDFNDIERQLAQTQPAPVQPAPATRNDPLAELARIVGQDDPFQSLLANEGAPRQRQQGSNIEDLFAVRNTEPAPRKAQAGHVEPAFEAGQYQQAEPHQAEAAYAYQSGPSAHGQGAYDNGAYAQEYYDENAAQAALGYGEPEPLDYPPLKQNRSRKGLLAIGAVVGAVVVGLGGAYVFTGTPSGGASGEPPLIKATNEPIKVQPQNPGGVEIPNQNKQIYERANQSGETKVVNREEQPVDVKQAVRMNGGTVADATGATVPAASAHGQQPANGLNLGEPRKVRTVSIRPDGSVARPEASNARSGSAPVPTMTLPAAAQPQPAAHATPATSAPVQTASAQPTPSQPKPSASTPVAAPTTPAPKPAAAVPAAATPTSGSSPQKVAAAMPVQTAPAAAATETAGTGGFSVQLAVRGSEGEAQAAFQQFQKKFSDLDGMPALIRKAEVNGNTVYRVRVGPLSKDEASSLCSKLQGQGGQCFVAKN